MSEHKPNIHDREIGPSRKPLPKVTTFFADNNNRNWVDIGLSKFIRENSPKLFNAQSIPTDIKEKIRATPAMKVKMFTTILMNMTHVTTYELKQILSILDIECTVTFKFRDNEDSAVSHTFN